MQVFSFSLFLDIIGYTGMATTSSESAVERRPAFKMIRDDPYLEPFEEPIQARFDLTQKWIKDIERNEGSLDSFSKGYEKYGFHVRPVRTKPL